MKRSLEQYGRRAMSGADTSVGGYALRGLLALAEPLYAALVTGRNLLYDGGGLNSHPLARPAISVGNITAGGTGKTPTVRWLCNHLRDADLNPAVLLRGYKIGSGTTSDEQVMLDHLLNDGSKRRIVIQANPSRLIAAQNALEEDSSIDVFVLDDAFQHRQVRRDFDLVLINAVDPFGYDHVHPRGLLREPLRGLGRADALLITRYDQVVPMRLKEIERRLRQNNRSAPIYYARHAHVGLRSADSPAADPPDHSLREIQERAFFAFSGIGNPDSLDRQLAELDGRYVGRHWFPDHHEYNEQEIAAVKREAAAAGADVLVTTEKDWVKIHHFPAARDGTPSIWRLELELQFRQGDDAQLLNQVIGAVARARHSKASARL